MTARFDFWADFINREQIRTMMEVGVWRGEFAEQMLRRCEGLERYVMLDPWRHLADWNKPANVSEPAFQDIYDEAMGRTDFAADRRIVLRGTTTEMSEQAPDDLDFVYIDGDHTLRGIAIDMIRCWPKVRPGGFMGGDDLCPNIWQHKKEFEPTLVFPFAVYFAEAQGAEIRALPHKQFIIHKSGAGFRFVDETGLYPAAQLQTLLNRRPASFIRNLGRAMRLSR